MENAKRGFEKLFIAEILVIIGSFSLFVTKEYWYLAIAFIVIDIAAFFINLKGLKLMAKDQEGYKMAYSFAIFGIVVDVVSLVLAVVFDSKSEAANILNNTTVALSDAIEFAICFIVLNTSIKYLQSVGNEELAKYADTTKNLLLFAYCVSIAIDFYLSTNIESWVALIGIIAGLTALVVVIIGQIRYIIFLKKMKETL
ncbi:MAG: hypothetical protein Q4E33_00560 [Erysipelotrichaceae bacterium]|nr:hypothetical protein [Erysipelotrichaceae bacterium]